MLAPLLLLPLLLTAVPSEGEGLARSGVSDRDLTKICKDVQSYFEALDKDDRSGQQQSLDKIEGALAKAAKKGKLDRSMLAYLGDWDMILEKAKPEERSIKGMVGKGFQRYVFADPWDTEGRRVVSMVSLPASYSKAPAPLPAIVGLKGALDMSGADLESAVAAKAAALYGDLVDTHIILIPVGLEQGSGRKAAANETEGSWYADANKYIFFTAFRILLEQLRFDRSQIILDGWGEAGLDALRLASASPSFFAGVVNRSGGVEDELAILENLKGVPILYVQGASDGGPGDVSLLEGVDGVEATVVAEAGSALEPSDDVRGTVAEWVRGRQRDLAPREIDFKVRDLLAASVSWCTAAKINRRVTASPDDVDFPRVRAKVDPGSNTIELETVNVLEVWLHLSDAIVDLDKPITITVNGEEKVRRKLFNRSLRNMLEGRFFNNSGDYGLYTAKVLVEDIAPNVPKKDS